MDTIYADKSLYNRFSQENPLTWDEISKVKAHFDTIPKPPRIEIWLSWLIPSGYIMKIPAIQHGEDLSLTKETDEIWFVNEEDFQKLDLIQKDTYFSTISIFRSGGIPLIKR